MAIEWIKLPGTTDYKETLDLMELRLADVISQKASECVILTQHNDTYTAGTSSQDSDLLDNCDIPVYYTGRGGKFTYHGPGQRVIYPILDLKLHSRSKDIKLYIRNLEQWIINSLRILGVKAYTIDGMVGIWVGKKNPAKIAAIGVRVKKWVTYHGIAVNISTNLDKYKGIIPCGINKFPVTSLLELGVDISMQEFDDILKKAFFKIF